jgi:hypothetical protein
LARLGAKAYVVEAKKFVKEESLSALVVMESAVAVKE